MTNLSKEQETALVAALANGGDFASPPCALFPTSLNIDQVWDGHPEHGYELTPIGRLLAQALKERDEALARCSWHR